MRTCPQKAFSAPLSAVFRSIVPHGPHRGEFETVVVWALDRLGRSMVGNLQAVLDLDRCGVKVISVNEPWLVVLCGQHVIDRSHPSRATAR